MMEVFYRLGPLHVNVVYETKPGKWLVEWRLYYLVFKFPHKDIGVVPITVPLICKICSSLNIKLFCFSINVTNWTIPSVGDSLTALWSQASRYRHYVGC
jgi:hypothetical protein